MKNISAQLKAHLALETTTLCTLWTVIRPDGLIFGFTDLSQDVKYNSLVYSASSGHIPSNIKTSGALNVDNLEVTANLGGIATAFTDVLNSSALTDVDVQAGLWDYSTVQICMVNYMDLSMGDLKLRKGKLGQIKTGRLQFIAELRGLNQNLQQNIGRIFGPACSTNLGTTKCGINLALYTFNGSVTQKIDQHSWVDSSLNQTQAVIQKPIQNIAAANPTIIQCNAHGLSTGVQISFSGITGNMNGINGFTGVIGYIDANTFSVSLDSTVFLDIQSGTNPIVYHNTSYSNGFNTTFIGSWNTGGGTYIGNGLVTVAVQSEYFQGGLVTWLTGLNRGLKMEVKSYRPNYVYLAQQMGYQIMLGDTYTISAGCDLLASTCNTRFNNIVNFRGFNLVPGQDLLTSGKL